MKRFALGSLALVASLAFAQPVDDKPKPLSFRAEARVEVDATGKLVKVEAAQDLPEGVQDYIEQQLSRWQYRRRLGEQASGIAATWVKLGVCAVPAANGSYSMGLAFEGNGPRLQGGQSWFVTEGVANAVGRHRYEGEAKVHFVINADGSARLESIEGLKGPGRKDIEVETKLWISRLKFDTETLDGRPVATSAVLPIVFRTSPRKDDQARRREEALQSSQCKMASMAADPAQSSSVAFDSDVGIIPSS